ncbi:hypothetical protein DVH24_013771 [Malus domestica]|uniref:Xylanase inhibitor C-terminal domain-containing protein n=1 Tax=Malus domestica TaxID=3750 RepID=A0A498JEB0_MALDO|nr:hypothetical protein DVH24_013771 [Malus domestica]
MRFVLMTFCREDDDHHHGIGFSLELIHRDSPSSPSYNPVGSHWQRLSNALQRSHHRVTNHFGRKGSGLRATSPIGSPFNLCCRRVFGEHIDWDTAQNFDRHCGHRQPSYVDAMQAVTAGKAAVSIPNTIFGCGHDNGGIFSGTETDSGTTITTSPTKLYQSFETAIRKAIHLEVTKDPTGILRLCYKTKPEIDAPIVTVHFRGADMKLKSVNTFVRFREDVVCLAFSPTNDVGIYGNVAQMNFLVGFDLQERTLSFKATDCGTG